MSARIEERPAAASTIAGFVRTGRAYVLIADDDVAEGQVFRDTMMENHFACDVVGNADDVLAAFTVRDYDLIVLNLRMGQAEALTAARQVREKERSFPEPRIPILLFSGGATEAEREKAHAAGIDDVVVRPQDAAGLMALLERFVETERRTPPSMIPREPIHYPALLALCGKDEARARTALEGFAQQLGTHIASLRQAIAAGQIAEVARLGDQVRQAAAQVASGRIQRAAFLLSKITAPRQLKETAGDQVDELAKAARDLEVWMRLHLGQSFLRSRPRVAPIKTHMIKLSSFLKKRMDVFSKAP